MPSLSNVAALSKRARISTAQKYMLLAVLISSVMLGVTLSLMVHFINQISFNNKVLGAQDEEIRNFTSTIETTGLCTSPKGDTYSDDELKKCNPATIEIGQIPNTLKSNILTDLAANEDLNSVQKETDLNCINPNNKDGKNYTYEEIRQVYNDAVKGGNEDEIDQADNLMQSCSALRIIPDALPSFKNEEALLASLNKLFNVSDWEPESLSPGGTSVNTSSNKGLNALSVSLSVEADSATTMRVLHNIERSIREFNISRATIEWGGENTLALQAAATAYYMGESSIEQTTRTIKPGDD